MKKFTFGIKEKGKEWCVSDEKELYEQLLKICVEYFKKKEAREEK